MQDVMLTTFDNPFNPFDNYDAWRAYDIASGHHTEAYLARVVVLSPDTSEVDQELAIEEAIDSIIKENVTGLHRKVSRQI